MVAREGWVIVAIFVVVATGATWGAVAWLGSWGWIVGGVGAALCVWCVWFFRDPVRSVPADPNAVICPADGVVCLVGAGAPPAELGLGSTGAMTRVCVFMNVFNVHVNRAPVAGKVVRVAHQKGRFFNAAYDKASEENERCSLVLERGDGTTVVAVQIAGLVARRIICRAKEGDQLGAGERYGLIRFGSRVDVYLPKGSDVLARVGEKVVAGETILARLASAEGRVERAAGAFAEAR
jgi:phosphatidylserine decarboxylase